MTDRELLELAAKAAGYKFNKDGLNTQRERDGIAALWIDSPMMTGWNPLAKDGDALRLAVALGINLNFGNEDEGLVNAFSFNGSCDVEEQNADGVVGYSAATTRRAIVRAAAEIGKAMK